MTILKMYSLIYEGHPTITVMTPITLLPKEPQVANYMQIKALAIVARVFFLTKLNKISSWRTLVLPKKVVGKSGQTQKEPTKSSVTFLSLELQKL